jgi:hypothetical protein
MRDKVIVAEHRGGRLSVENHRRLMTWAIFCLERVLPCYPDGLDDTLLNAVKIAKEWKDGRRSTGDAVRVAGDVQALAKSLDNKIACMIARAAGQAVATAHMADHCAGAALYPQKALKLSGESSQDEKEIQIRALRDLPAELSNFIVESMEIKTRGMGL